jgi:hypothetical protein
MFRVVHGGTGLTGREALRGIINDPELELVALHVTTPQKVGVDAGTLCGLPPTGIRATDDIQAVIDLEPDCFSYGGTSVGRVQEACDDVARLLRAGINVVTFAIIPMVYPPAAPAAYREVIERACQDGSASFYATGIEPGVASLNVSTAVLACAGQVDRVTLDQYALNLDTVYPIWDVLHESMGFGKPPGHVPARIAGGRVRHDWEPVIAYLAAILGVTLDSIELDWETITTPKPLNTAAGVIEAGTICGHRWRLGGTVGPDVVVAMQFFATVNGTPWPASWPRPSGDVTSALVLRVAGRPTMHVEFCYDPQAGEDGLNAVIPMTAMSAVNAIPYVARAAPGVYGPLHGPAMVTRQTAHRTPDSAG